MVGRHEDGDRCVRWLGHTPPNPIRGRMESHILRGVAFLRTNNILCIIINAKS